MITSNYIGSIEITSVMLRHRMGDVAQGEESEHESLDESGNSRNLRAAEALTSDRVPHHACGETVRAPKSETAFTLPGNHIMAKSC